MGRSFATGGLMAPRLSLLPILLVLFSPLHEPSSGTVSASPDPCAPPANPIVCENSKPGTPPSEWDVPIGQPRYGDVNIQGFATDISANVGERVHFKVNTDASAYRIDIYRIGYYGGLGARKMATVRPVVALPQKQPA